MFRVDCPADRGASESLQWAMLTPVVLLLLLGALQVGLLWHGRNTLVHAAAAAAEAESVFDARAGAGQRAAETIATAGGVSGVRVRVTRTRDRVDVEVTGTVPVLVDLGLGRVSRTSSAPLERAT